MKGVVIYNGNYGATKQYAEWIGKKLNLSIINSHDISGSQLTNYSFIVLGSSVYFGKLLLSKWLKENLSFLHNKRLFLFSVSGTPPDQTQVLQGYIQNSVPAEIRNSMEVYFFPGRLNTRSLSWFHYYMLKVGAWLENDPATKKRMLTEYDAVQIEHIRPLERSVGKFCSVPAMS
jgi:menaquinone-dependent protoporphyrinogen IX oxidase